jgi:hypothetical protein
MALLACGGEALDNGDIGRFLIIRGCFSLEHHRQYLADTLLLFLGHVIGLG